MKDKSVAIAPIAKNFLLATSLVTLAVISPLNSIFPAHPRHPVCLSCVVNLYGGLILFVTLWLQFSQRVLGRRPYEISLKTMTIIALVFFLHAVQISTVPSSWRTAFVIVCILGMLPMVISFIRGKKETATLFLLFALVLSVYEIANLFQIVNRAEAQSDVSPKTVTTPSQDMPGLNLPHIFLIVFDEYSLIQILKDDVLDPDIVPNLVEFSKVATWYRKSVTLYAGTDHAIPALLTGREMVGSFEEEFLEGISSDNLIHEVAKTHDVYINGYALPYCEAFRKNLTACRTYLRGFSHYYHLFLWWWERAIPGELRDTGLVRPVQNTIVQLFDFPRDQETTVTKALLLGQDFNRPVFTYIHAGLPHFPYVFRANGDLRRDRVEYPPSPKTNKEDLATLQEYYREQIVYTDELFGTFLAKLKSLNVFDQALIVVTSDHGISFDPAYPGRRQDWINLEAISRVPQFIKLPGQGKGMIDDCPVSIIDLYSTILDTLGLDGSEAQGVSLLKKNDWETDSPLLTFSNPFGKGNQEKGSHNVFQKTNQGWVPISQ